MAWAYDYLIVGSGLFGAAFAQQAHAAGKKCLVLEKRNHIGGNVYTREIEGIQVHCYGAHIFHTDNQRVWDYASRFANMNHFINSPIANYKGRIYHLPFNMNTFYEMWGVITPEQAQKELHRQRAECLFEEPQNLEEMALKMIGRDIYEKLVRGYTEKQWGRPCDQLPASIIRRLPFRLTYDNNYFQSVYQGIPVGGYTAMVKRMLEGVEVRVDTDFLLEKSKYEGMAKKVVYTGPIDAFFGYCYGPLGYRSLRFETEVLDIENHQGNAVVNYTDRETPYTRIIEHKHFEFGTQPRTVITKEYPKNWLLCDEPYYPVNDGENDLLFAKYDALAKKEKKVLFGGRLGLYQYLDMDRVIEKALEMAELEGL